MKASKILATSALALIAVTTAHADTVIHITGSTAFRSATVAAITGLMTSPRSAWDNNGGSSISGANRCVIQGAIASVPAAGVVTVKCSWSGSTGGIKTVVENIPVTNWMSITNLPVSGTQGVTNPSFALDTGTFPGESSLADICMQDSLQASTGFTSATLVETKVGVIPFEWVAGNGAPSTLDNITPLLAQAVISGGAPLSQFTGNIADTTYVYAAGRDFDSGTRLSCLAETGVGIFGGVQHVQAESFTGGNAGTATAQIARVRYTPATTLLGQDFLVGNSGYSSGGTLADVLATPGAATAQTSGGTVDPSEELLFGPGHLIGYLGRADANRACKTDVITGNTAHRMKWCGLQLWNGPIGASGAPASYNDNLIAEGVYQLWEYEWLGYRSSYTGNGKAVADALALRIKNTVSPATGGINLSTMHVSKATEGGLITH